MNCFCWPMNDKCAMPPFTCSIHYLTSTAFNCRRIHSFHCTCGHKSICVFLIYSMCAQTNSYLCNKIEDRTACIRSVNTFDAAIIASKKIFILVESKCGVCKHIGVCRMHHWNYHLAFFHWRQTHTFRIWFQLFLRTSEKLIGGHCTFMQYRTLQLSNFYIGQNKFAAQKIEYYMSSFK